MLPSFSSRDVDPTDLEPVSDGVFAQHISPCLQLVAPVGMDMESQATWIEAAHKALAGIPIGLLKRGCETAMRNADHPAKIVKAITDEIGESWATRKRLASSSRPEPMPALAEPERCTPEQARAILEEFGLAGKFESERA